MSTAREVLQKLLRSPKPRKKSDLLNQREYEVLAATSFEQFLAENFNEDQIGKLCAAEMEQLHFHYTEMEKKSARIMKKIRGKTGKGTTGIPRVVIRNVPARTASATSIVRAAPPIPVEVPDTGADPVLENIENAIEEDRGVGQPQVEELNTSLERIDLSRSMAPRELLLEEPMPVPLPPLVEIDLGPPGDAGAFFGSTDPMPIDDPQVREQVLSEFPSLRRPQIDRRYEDVDEDLNARLMPPPNVPGSSGLSSSTPIATDPQLRRRLLGAIDLSFIKYPTPAAADALLRSDESSSQTPNVETAATIETAAPDISSIPQPEVSSEDQRSSSNVDSGHPTSTEVDSGPQPEPMLVEPVPEPIPNIQPPPTPQGQPRVPPAAPSSTSSSSSGRSVPARGVVSRTRRVPVFDPSKLVIKVHARTTFPLGHDDDADDYASMYETDQQLIERLLQMRAARNAVDHVAQRQVVPQAVDDQQPSLRDISSGAAYADISSIRELPSGSGGTQLQTSTSGALYPIPERPQVEEREELALRKSMPVGAKSLGDSMELSVSDKRAQSLVEPVIDVPNLEAPQIVITGTAEEGRGLTVAAATATAALTTEPTNAEKPIDEIQPISTVPEVPTVPTRDGQCPEVHQGQDPERVIGGVKDEKKFTELLKLYLTINHAAKTARHGTVSMEHLQVLECNPRNKLNCCKLFGKLLQLKKLGLVENGVDERGRIRSVTVKG